MDVLTLIFYIAVAVSVFCAVLAGTMKLVKELFFFIWGVKDEEAVGVFWDFMRKGTKILLSISVWVMGIVMTIGVTLLIMIAFYNLCNM